MKHSLSFSAGCLTEFALLVFAWIWGALFHRPPLGDFHWSLKDACVGLLAVIPPFIFFLVTLRFPVFARHKQLMEELFRPLFKDWSVLQLAVLSLLAGIGEEALFRGAIQGSLAERVGVALAVILSSALFGASHLITWTYGIMAAVVSIYLGFLWVETGNLLTPMVTHAVYDLVALVYFLKIRQSQRSP